MPMQIQAQVPPVPVRRPLIKSYGKDLAAILPPCNVLLYLILNLFPVRHDFSFDCLVCCRHLQPLCNPPLADLLAGGQGMEGNPVNCSKASKNLLRSRLFLCRKMRSDGGLHCCGSRSTPRGQADVVFLLQVVLHG